MKYFVKYLATEPYNNIPLEATNTIYPNWDVNRYRDNNKLKLFLCSKNIIIGDNVLNFKLYNNGSYKYKEFKVSGEYHSGKLDPEDNRGISRLDMWNEDLGDNKYTSYDMDETYKIIGEISKDAIWVKDGDEFNEDDIKRDILIKETFDNNYIHLHPKGNETMRKLTSTERFIRELPIKIKCLTCKIYH